MKVNNYPIESPSVNDLLFGSKNFRGETVNFRVQDVVNLTQAPAVISTNTLTSYILVNINTYFTGTAASTLAISFPPASESIDGVKYVIMSTTNRPNLLWSTPGSSGIVGAPSSLVANTPICFQYNNSDTKWYISM